MEKLGLLVFNIEANSDQNIPDRCILHTLFSILNYMFIDDPLITQLFPGSARAGNVTLTDDSVTYQFQMTASTFLGREENEGNLSTITPESTIFVPERGRYNIIYLHSVKALDWGLKDPEFQSH